MRHSIISFPLALVAGLSQAWAGGTIGTITNDPANWSLYVNQAPIIDFDSFTGPVHDQFAGITLDPFADGDPIATEYLGLAHSGDNLLNLLTDRDLGGGVSLTFDPPVDGFGFYYDDCQFEGSSMNVYAFDGEPLASYQLEYPHPGEWLYFGEYIAQGKRIGRVDLTINSSDYVPLDDLAFGFERNPDLNHDGHVNGIDLALLLGGWGRCTPNYVCPADIDGNGTVNGIDLANLLGAWAP